MNATCTKRDECKVGQEILRSTIACVPVSPVYISGPMSGYAEHNFPLFNRVEKWLLGVDWNLDVFNPASNFGGALNRERCEYMQLDLRAVLRARCVVVLPGWQASRGASLEVWMSFELGHEVFKLCTGNHCKHEFSLMRMESPFEDGPVGCGSVPKFAFRLPFANDMRAPDVSTSCTTPPTETVLEEAQRLVSRDRQGSYGHPLDDFTKTVRMWEVILGMPAGTLVPEQMALCMVAVKISREMNAHKRDNLVDMAGYAATIEEIKLERQRRSAVRACGTGS